MKMITALGSGLVVSMYEYGTREILEILSNHELQIRYLFSEKPLRYIALGMDCTLTAVSRSTQSSTLCGAVK